MNKLLTVCVFAAVIGCDKKIEQVSEKAAENNHATAEQVAKEENPTYEFEVIKKEYEACRKLLAEDSTKGIKEHALKIAQASQEKLAEAANELASLKGDDIAEARLLFGEMSKQLIELLSKESSFANDLHVFECPMAKGYKKWVQPNDELENPYMGSSMLHCGSKSTY